MALSRTWYSRANIPFPDTSTAQRVSQSKLWLLKAFLKGEISTGTVGASGAQPAGSNWTCVGSSDGTTAALDGTDRWTSTFDASKLVRTSTGSTAHSWIVLQAPTALHSSLFLTLQYRGATDNLFRAFICYTAPTGGSITARPTLPAVFSQWGRPVSGSNTAFDNDVNLMGDTTAAVTHNFHYAIDADGNTYSTNGRVGSNNIQNFHVLTKLVETKTGDNFAIAHFFNKTTGNQVNSTQTNAPSMPGQAWGNPPNADSIPVCLAMHAFDNSGAERSYMLHPTFMNHSYYAAGNAGVGDADAKMSSVNLVDNKWDLFPMFIYHANNSRQGIRGRLPDAHFAPYSIGTFSYEPTTGAPERVLLGSMLVPMGVNMVL